MAEFFPIPTAAADPAPGKHMALPAGPHFETVLVDARSLQQDRARYLPRDCQLLALVRNIPPATRGALRLVAIAASSPRRSPPTSPNCSTRCWGRFPIAPGTR